MHMRALYTVEEVAEKLGVGPFIVKTILRSGKMECNRIGSRIRISEESLDAYIDSTCAAYKPSPKGPVAKKAVKATK
jgi:excisionase family DNA binding protein